MVKLLRPGLLSYFLRHWPGLEVNSDVWTQPLCSTNLLVTVRATSTPDFIFAVHKKGKAAKLGIVIGSENWEVCARTHVPSGSMPDLQTIAHCNWSPAQLPFDAIAWLHESGLGPDPMVGQNDLQYRWAEEVDWVLRKRFDVSPGIVSPEDELHLVLKQLDWYCDVYLNGTLLGRAANQFREHVFDIDSVNIGGTNELLLYIRSARHVTSLLESAYGQLPAGFDTGRVHARRSQTLTGWDFTPRLSSVSLLHAPEIRENVPISIMHPYVYTTTIPAVEIGQAQVNTALLQLSVELSSRRRGSGEITWEIFDPVTNEPLVSKTEQLSIKSKSQPLRMTVELPDARLWWSAGIGDQPIYKAVVRLSATDRLGNHYDAQQTCTFGVRTLTIDRRKDDLGESFTPLLNGHPIYCRGANWLPVNMLPSRIKTRDYSELIGMVLGAGMNCLRVWGGGTYEHDEFYDVCDRAGILVWQDFMFACAAYPVYREFLDEVEAEAIYQVTRLRNHPCLMLWCGNNENEWLHQTGNLKKGNEQRVIGETIWSHVLQEIVEDYDPSRVYHQSSPFGRNRSDFNDMATGDRHSWDVWADWQPSDSYLLDNGRFITEFGVQSLPQMATLDQFAPGDYGELTNPTLAHHQRMEDGMERLVRYTVAHYALPQDVTGWVRTSQELQTLLVGRAVEHWRKRRALTAGSLIWHFNEPYPGITWSLLDYYRRPKHALLAAKRFFSPVLLSLEVLVLDKPVFAVQPDAWMENQPRREPTLLLEGTDAITCMMPIAVVECKLHVINGTSVHLSGKVSGGFFRGGEEVETLATVQVDASPNGAQTVLTYVLDKALMHAIRELEVRAEFHLDEESTARLAQVESQVKARQVEILSRTEEDEPLLEPIVPVSYADGLRVNSALVEPKYFQKA